MPIPVSDSRTPWGDVPYSDKSFLEHPDDRRSITTTRMSSNLMWRFAKDLYEGVSRRQSLTDENFTTTEKLRSMALELAAAPKYNRHLFDFTCSNSWITRFRKDFNFDRKSEKRGPRTLCKEDQQCIINYADKNRDLTLHEIALRFSNKFEKVAVNTFISGKEASTIRETFSQDLYEEICRRQSLTDEDFTTNEKLRALALELSEDSKYHGYLKRQISEGKLKFSYHWLNNFRKNIRKNGEKWMDGKEDANVNFNLKKEVDLIKACKETFSQDLFEEISRRQSLTDEKLTTNENLRVLALELAADPKYKGYLRSLKFCKSWLCRFREKYNLNDGERNFSITEKQQILQYTDNNPKSTLKEIAEHFSTVFGRSISTSTVSAIRRNREKLMKENVKETFLQDLYEEMSRRQSLTDENLTTNANLRALALELAADPKYKGYLSSQKFSNGWLYLFRRRINLKDTERLTEEKGTH